MHLLEVLFRNARVEKELLDAEDLTRDRAREDFNLGNQDNLGKMGNHVKGFGSQ
jgi:hypothetical protein